MKPVIMKKIFEYSNYREFLRDFYTNKKSEFPAFSFRLFADKAGFKSKSFIQDVINGKKNISEDSAEKLNKVLKLKSEEFQFLLTLIAFNQSKTVSEQNQHLRKIEKIKTEKRLTLLRDSQYCYFEKWYHKAIRELICVEEFDEDYATLAQQLSPPITEEEARSSVALLKELRLIEKKGNQYKQTDVLLTTGNEVASLAVMNFHLDNLDLAKEKINSCPREERDISTLIVGLSEKGFSKYKKEVQKFRKALLAIADEEQDIDRVYHMNFQLYPVTTPIKPRKSE